MALVLRSYHLRWGLKPAGDIATFRFHFRSRAKSPSRPNIVHFFQINYAKYPKDTVVTTYQDPPTQAFARSVDKVRDLLGSAGSDISSRLVSEGTLIETETFAQDIGPGPVRDAVRDRQAGSDRWPQAQPVSGLCGA